MKLTPVFLLTTQDEKRCTCHILRSKFGKKLIHKLVFRAATLEDALVQASMPTKGVTTFVQQHFPDEFVNEAIKTYTKVLLVGSEPQFHLLIWLPPPPQFQICEPDKNGLPRR